MPQYRASAAQRLLETFPSETRSSTSSHRSVTRIRWQILTQASIVDVERRCCCTTKVDKMPRRFLQMGLATPPSISPWLPSARWRFVSCSEPWMEVCAMSYRYPTSKQGVAYYIPEAVMLRGCERGVIRAQVASPTEPCAQGASPHVVHSDCSAASQSAAPLIIAVPCCVLFYVPRVGQDELEAARNSVEANTGRATCPRSETHGWRRISTTTSLIRLSAFRN